MRVFRDGVLTALVIVFLCYSPFTLADSYNDWPDLEQWKQDTYKQCHSKHNSGTDAENFYQCQTQKLLQDFPMPAGQDSECAKKAGKNPSAKRYQQNINQCLVSLVSNTSSLKKSVAKMLSDRPDLEAALESCEQEFNASGQPYALKWQLIRSCLKKAALKTKAKPATTSKPVLVAKPEKDKHSHQECEAYAKEKAFPIAAYRSQFMTQCRLTDKPMDELYAQYDAQAKSAIAKANVPETVAKEVAALRNNCGPVHDCDCTAENYQQMRQADPNANINSLNDQATMGCISRDKVRANAVVSFYSKGAFKRAVAPENFDKWVDCNTDAWLDLAEKNGYPITSSNEISKLTSTAKKICEQKLPGVFKLPKNN